MNVTSQEALDSLEVAEDCALEANIQGASAYIARLRNVIRSMPQAMAEREAHMASVYRAEIEQLMRQNREPDWEASE